MKRLSIKLRLLFLVIIPIIAIVLLSVSMVVDTIKDKSILETTKNRVLETEALAKVVHCMQVERGLSVGFSASGGKNNGDSLLSLRKKVDIATQELKKVYELTNGDDDKILNSFINLTQQRAAIDSNSMESAEVEAYFTNIIITLVDATTFAPSLIESKEIRNTIQAYTHMASAKESMGQIRANLNVAFSRDSFSEKDYFAFLGRVNTYDVNIRKFTNLTSQELKKFYEDRYKGEVVNKMTSMMNIAKDKGMQGGFGIDSSVWFSSVTSSINLLRDVELELFKVTNSTIEDKLEKATSNIVKLTSAVIIGIVVFTLFLLYFIKISISNPLEKFETTLLDITKNNNLTIQADEDAPLELSQMASGFNSLISTLRDLIETSKQSSSENASIS
ncbi:methyl-accepting chemotaxis protein, partial [Sulfurimonas sp.]|uniref:nitrate- and nitrite sensing domain-containing protein n=1 Tax=Sulfurimonas sp. TaxID=2022749 RepID=UPI0025FC699F